MAKHPWRTRLVGWLFLFLLGAAAGYYVSEQRHDEQVRGLVESARREAQERALDAIQRAQAAGGDLRAGAAAAAESTRAAFQELTGGR